MKFSGSDKLFCWIVAFVFIIDVVASILFEKHALEICGITIGSVIILYVLFSKFEKRLDLKLE